MTATISIRPVTVTAQIFNDGVTVFTSAMAEPLKAWGLFVDHADGTISGLAPDRDTALEAARKMAEENGWTIAHVASEGAVPCDEGGRSLQ